MPDAFDRKLQELLSYPRPPAPGDDPFVADVMRELRAERRRRHVILSAFGGIGAAFGLAGAAMLLDDIAGVFTRDISAMALTQGALFLAGAAAFYSWFMNDDWSTGG
ncbi:MAG: hypothetical protein KJN78_11290 [Gammaproteobacteria bacterium]|nr:hypothetical protein [Gammaproteobacteria bacterium]